MDIQTRRLRPIGQLSTFVEGSGTVVYQPQSRKEAYAFVREVLGLGYQGLGKGDKGVVLAFLVTVTGFTRKQMERLVRQWCETGGVRDRRGGNCGRPFARRCTLQDIRLLAAVDAAFGQMSELATRGMPATFHQGRSPIKNRFHLLPCMEQPPKAPFFCQPSQIPPLLSDGRVGRGCGETFTLAYGVAAQAAPPALKRRSQPEPNSWTGACTRSD